MKIFILFPRLLLLAAAGCVTLLENFFLSLKFLFFSLARLVGWLYIEFDDSHDDTYLLATLLNSAIATLSKTHAAVFLCAVS